LLSAGTSRLPATIAQTGSMIEIRAISLAQTLDLRDALLSPGHPGRPVVWPYDDDAAVHYGAFGSATRELVGCVSICPGSMDGSDPTTSYRLHSMAVQVEWQGMGIGRQMLEHVAAEVSARNAELMFATARSSALGFYLRCGMTPGGFMTVEQTGFRFQYVSLDRDGIRELAKIT
jgi:GNAT superfamily N-acetyltransferase